MNTVHTESRAAEYMSNDMAFPVLDREQTPNGTYQLGLTKREYFAAMAMQGWMAGCQNAYSEFTGPASFPKTAAYACVKFADALIEALSDEKETT